MDPSPQISGTVSPQGRVLRYEGPSSRYVGPTAAHLVPAVTSRDIPWLIHQLATNVGGEDCRISAAEHLARLTQTTEGRDHVAAAVNGEVIQHLVGLLSDPGSLRENVVIVLAVVLYFDHTWDGALNTPVIPLLVSLLTDPSPETQVSAACALANITRRDPTAKTQAAGAGAIPPLVVALGSPSIQLKEMAVRAMKNIASVDSGQRAVYNSNALEGLVALLADSRLSLKIQCDVVSTLALIDSHSRDARNKLKQAGLFRKLTRFKDLNIPEAIKLRDNLR